MDGPESIRSGSNIRPLESALLSSNIEQAAAYNATDGPFFLDGFLARAVNSETNFAWVQRCGGTSGRRYK